MACWWLRTRGGGGGTISFTPCSGLSWFKVDRIAQSGRRISNLYRSPQALPEVPLPGPSRGESESFDAVGTRRDKKMAQDKTVIQAHFSSHLAEDCLRLSSRRYGPADNQDSVRNRSGAEALASGSLLENTGMVRFSRIDARCRRSE